MVEKTRVKATLVVHWFVKNSFAPLKPHKFYLNYSNLFIFRSVTITEAQFCMVWYHGEMDALGVAPLVSIQTSILLFHGLIKL